MYRVILIVLIAAIVLPGCAINKRLDKIESYIESDKANTKVFIEAINADKKDIENLAKFALKVDENMQILSCYAKSETPGQESLMACIKQYQEQQKEQSGQTTEDTER